MIRHPQWREEHGLSKFPFEDNATLVSDQEDFFLTETTFLDAVLYPPRIVGRLHISVITVGSLAVRIDIGDDENESVCHALASLADTDLYHLPVVDNFGQDAGLLITEPLRLSAITSWPAGEYRFDDGAAPFVSAVSLSPGANRGVAALHIVDPLVGDKYLSGEVWLVGDEGVTLSVSSVGNKHTIRFDLVGEPLFKRKLCEPGLFQTPRFLRQIVFQKGKRSHTALPNEFGDVPITVDSRQAGDTILRIHHQDGALTFETVGEQLQGIR